MAKEIKEKYFGIKPERWIASWWRVCMERGEFYPIDYYEAYDKEDRKTFRSWLESLEMDPDEIRELCNFAMNGKCEVEGNLRNYLGPLEKKPKKKFKLFG